MNLSIKLLTHIDAFVPPAMRNTIDLTWDYRIKVWSMIMVLALSLLAPLTAALVFACLHVFTDYDFSQACYILLVLISLSFVQHLFFQSYGKLEITARAYAIQAFVSYFAAVYLTGGWYSPTMPILLCSPMIAFMTGGHRLSIAATIAVFLSLCFFFNERYNPAIDNVLSPDTAEIIGFVMWQMLLGVMAFFLMVVNTLICREDIRLHFEKS